MTTPRYYIWLNAASPSNYYWSQPAQNWTTNGAQATMFETREAAEQEAAYATAYGMGEAHVLRTPGATQQQASGG